MNVTVVDWAVLLGLVLLLFAADLLAATLRPLSGLPEIGTVLSLAVIGGVLAVTAAASLARSRRPPAALRR